MGAQAHAQGSPGVEMVRCSDSSAGPLALTDGPVLVEGCRADDRGLVDLLVLIDIIGRTVAGDSAHVGHAGSGVVGSIAFENVVFD